MYDIEKDVPVKKRGDAKYPLEKLEVNDSFLIPLKDLEDNTQQSVLTIAKQKNINITTRKTDQGLRVWRIS